MKQILAYGPATTLKITDVEVAAAKSALEDVKSVEKKLDDAVRTIIALKEAITQQRPSKDDLSGKYRGRFLRYKRKLEKSFNEFAETGIKILIDKLNTIADPEMERIKEILVSEARELRDGIARISELLMEPDRDNFTQTLEGVSAQIEKRQRSIHDVIDNQLINHINQDILGKLKISELHFRIKRGSRILKILARRK